MRKGSFATVSTPIMNRRDIKFYDLRASETLTASARKLLREYSGIQDDEAIDKHVEDIVRFPS